MIREYTTFGIPDIDCEVGKIIKDWGGNNWKITKIVQADGQKKEKGILRYTFTCKVVKA